MCSGMPVVLPDHEGVLRVVPGGDASVDRFRDLVFKAAAGTLSDDDRGEYEAYPKSRTD